MSYHVLARKWRPHTFENMVGQEPILRMLANALDQKRLHHAYLFTGTRGVGKTTIARILAKCLNCESGVTSKPCGTCHACKAIDNGQFLDLFEVDGASRTKVEDTRELLENVCYPPNQGRFKIYLIDEVHMLSNHSFNALLKTLEEPPEHVKFLFATTDPKRLPITILSRCLQFHLKRIAPEQIAKQLSHICAQETIPHEPAALEKIAKAGDGSMRDALSLLDQAIAYGHGTVKNADVNAMLGCMSQDDLCPLLQALSEHDGKAVFRIINELAELAPNFEQLLDELISLFHHIALSQLVPQAITTGEAILALAKRFSPEEVQLYYQIALLGRRDLTMLSNQKQGFEMTLIRMLAFAPAPKEETLTSKKPPALVKATPEATPEIAAIKEMPKQVESPVASRQTPEWREILPKLELSGMAYALASNCTLEKVTGHKVELALSATHLPMLNPKLKERIAEGLGRYYQHPIVLEIHTTNEEIVTPVKQQQQERSERFSQAKETVLQDPKIQKLIEMYDATIEVSLLS